MRIVSGLYNVKEITHSLPFSIKVSLVELSVLFKESSLYPL